MSNTNNWNAKAAREGERRREERPHYIGDVVVRYRRLYGGDEDKAAIIVEIPNQGSLFIGPLRSAVAKETFDSIGQPMLVGQFEIKVGDRVRVRGDGEDCTEYLDGKVGVVMEIRRQTYCDHYDYSVKFDGHEGTMWIWSYNIVEVLK